MAGMQAPRTIAPYPRQSAGAWAAKAKALSAALPAKVAQIAGLENRSIVRRSLSVEAVNWDTSSETNPRSMPTAIAQLSHDGAEVTSSIPWARWERLRPTSVAATVPTIAAAWDWRAILRAKWRERVSGRSRRGGAGLGGLRALGAGVLLNIFLS